MWQRESLSYLMWKEKIRNNGSSSGRACWRCGEDFGLSLVNAIYGLFLLFNYFAYKHGYGIRGYKAWSAWNVKKHELVEWLYIDLTLAWLCVQTFVDMS